MKKGRGKDKKQRKRKGKGILTVKNALLGVGGLGAVAGTYAYAKSELNKKSNLLEKQAKASKQTARNIKNNTPKKSVNIQVNTDAFAKALEAKRIELGRTPKKLSKTERSLKLQKYRESLGDKPSRLKKALNNAGRSETRGSRQSRTLNVLGVAKTTRAKRKQLVGFNRYD